MKRQQTACQEQGACTPSTVTVCCGNDLQGLGASLRAGAPLPSQSQLKLLQQPLHLSSYTLVSPRKPQLPAKSGACSSLIGSRWVLLIHVNGATLIHGSWLESQLQEFHSQRCLSPDLVALIGEIKSCPTNTWFGIMIFAQMGACVCV